MNDDAWVTLESREVYSDCGFTVVENRVSRPNGTISPYGVIHAAPGTAVIALSPSNEVTLVGQFRYPLARYTWELPGGGVEAGESPMDAARRELFEETGITAGKWLALGNIVHVNSSISAQASFAFLAWELEDNAGAKDEMEITQVQAVTLEMASEMAERGEISDALSQIAILRALNITKKSDWRALGISL